MARRPFRIVVDLDLSGNKLVDVKEISRRDYETLTRDLTIKSGSGVAVAGGALNLFSGAGTTPGAINLFLGKDTANKHGIELLGSSAVNIRTNNQDISLYTGTAAVKVKSTVDATSNTTGALQVAGGVYVAKNVFLSGNITTDKTSITLLNETATTVSIAGAATTLNIAAVNTLVQTINIGTAVPSATVQTINLGGATSGGTVNIASVKDANTTSAALKISGGVLVGKNAGLVHDRVERRLVLPGVLVHGELLHHRVVHHDRQAVDERFLGDGLGFGDTRSGNARLLVGLTGGRYRVGLLFATGQHGYSDHAAEGADANCRSSIVHLFVVAELCRRSA